MAAKTGQAVTILVDTAAIFLVNCLPGIINVMEGNKIAGGYLEQIAEGVDSN